MGFEVGQVGRGVGLFSDERGNKGYAKIDFALLVDPKEMSQRQIYRVVDEKKGHAS
jgi:hypothetical protein